MRREIVLAGCRGEHPDGFGVAVPDARPAGDERRHAHRSPIAGRNRDTYRVTAVFTSDYQPEDVRRSRGQLSREVSEAFAKRCATWQTEDERPEGSAAMDYRRPNGVLWRADGFSCLAVGVDGSAIESNGASELEQMFVIVGGADERR
jgi:hypothetical protein